VEELEQRMYEELATEIAQRVRLARPLDWVQRRVLAYELLRAVTRAWWRVYEQAPASYAADLTRLNVLAGWSGEYKQLPFWNPSDGSGGMLMAPKFFGGNPSVLAEPFVASMSLNHAAGSPESQSFQNELADQQSASSAVAAHSEYFLRPYAYERFFSARARVLSGYVEALQRHQASKVPHWREINGEWSLYIEAFPTWSRKFRPPATGVCARDLQSSVFVCALNSLVHKVVLNLLQPRAVLLAGRATWGVWPDPALSSEGHDVSATVRPVGRSCRVYVFCGASSLGHLTRVVRSNFLRTVFGPNSNDELDRLGRHVLATAG
jgi:hypothetical protein